MYIKKSEYEVIKNALENFLPEGVEFARLPEAQQNSIVEADTALLEILKRHKAQNRKTADYIASKRKENKNYAR